MLQEQSAAARVLLVDGMALLFRAFYATSYGGYIMKTSAGVPTNAVYGFVKYFWDAAEKFRPTHIVCCWDMGSKTFRTEKFADYKANRVDCPEELIPQFELVKEVTESFGVVNIGLPGYEADDCIGTLAKLYRTEAEVYILTGDHDMLQLVDERINVVIMKKGQGNYAVYTPAVLLEEKQLTPQQFIDLKGLMGDTADNYPGVKGIGEKTATKLLLEYGSVEGIVANLSLLTKSVRAKIEADLEMLYLCRELATINCEAPVACAIEESQWRPDEQTVRDKLAELEFSGLLKEIGRFIAAS